MIKILFFSNNYHVQIPVSTYIRHECFQSTHPVGENETHAYISTDTLHAAEPGDSAPQGPDTGRWNEDILRVLKGDINDLPLPVPTTVRIYLAGPLPGT